MKRLNSHKYNVLLVKDDVGHPKPSTRNLPNAAFEFGDPVPRDPEDVRKGKLLLKDANAAYASFFSYLCVAIFAEESPQDAGQRFQATKQVSAEQSRHYGTLAILAPLEVRFADQASK